MHKKTPENTLIAANKSEETSFFRYAVVVEYRGAAYEGSQKQLNGRTIQSELENVLNILTKSDIKTIFSGRTDAGVHAKGQVVHFDLSHKVDTYRFIHSMNAILPTDINIADMVEVSPSFHSQKSALFRWYRYIINNRSQRSVWLRETIHIKDKLNVDEMNKALSYLVGKHDFSSFKAAGSANPSKECIMHLAECRSENNVIYIDFVANRFLYNMIRIIVGTLLSIGKGIFPADHMLEVLNSKNRDNAGPTARPEGLTFMLVGYSKELNPLNIINMEANKDENIFCKAS